MSDYRTFKFNEVSALDKCDVYIDTVQISTPERIEHVKQLPYMSGEYDMDKILGYPTYGPRTIIYTCQLIEENSRAIDDVITVLSNWLMGPVEGTLQDTATPTYHYKAKCISIVPAVSGEYAELTITFKAYPFKIKNSYVNEMLWDDINFEYTEFQQTEFSIAGQETIILNNLSACPVALKCTTSNVISIKVDGITHQFSGSGTVPFLLLPGKNVLNVTVVSSNLTTNINFDWIEEIL